MIVVAMIGFGNSVVRYHLPFLKHRDDIFVKYVYRRPEDRQDPLELAREQKYPSITFTSNMDDVLNDPTVDFVVINTPDATHSYYAKIILNAGKHVLVEKPFALASKTAKAIFDLANQKNLICYVNQNRRYDTDYLSLKAALDSQKLGDIIEIESHYHYQTPDDYGIEKREWGWFLFSLGVHNLDQMIALFGMPDHVDYDVRSFVTAQGEDTFTITLHYGLMQVKVSSSLFSKFKKPRFYVEGTQGTFIKYPQGNISKVQGEEPYSLALKQEPETNFGKMLVYENKQIVEHVIPSEITDYSQVYDDVYASIYNQQPPKVKQAEIIKVIEIIEAALKHRKQK